MSPELQIRTAPAGHAFQTFQPPQAHMPARWATPRIRLYWQMLGNYIDTWPAQLYNDLVVDCAPHFPGALFISDPAIIRHIFRQDSDGYQTSWQQRRICTSLFGGASIASSEGAEWAEDRAIYERALSAPRMAGVAPDIARNARAMTDEWARADGAVRIDGAIGRFSLRNIAALALDWKPTAYVDRLAGELDGAGDSVGRITATSLIRQLRFAPINARGKGSRSLISLEEKVQREIECRRISGRLGDDLLGAYLALSADGEGEAAADRRACSNILAFIAAGFDTTAAALCWFLFLLASSPDAQRHVREELQDFGAGTGSSPPPASPFSRAMLQETLRLYPSLPLLARTAMRDDGVAGIDIPAGTTVFVSPYVVHRHRRLWSDPDLFDPFRFVGEHRKDHAQGAYLPFGVGKRSCVGFQLAYREILTAAAAVLDRFELSVDPEHRVRVRSRMGLRPEGGIYLRFKPRGRPSPP